MILLCDVTKCLMSFTIRGRGDVPFQSPQAYSVGYTHDLRQTIQYIHRKYPRRLLFGVGYSLGSNYLARYMGEEGRQSLLTAAVSCACPTDPLVCNVALQRRPLINRLLAYLIKRVFLVEDTLKRFEKRFNIRKSKRAMTLRQVFRSFTSHVCD